MSANQTEALREKLENEIKKVSWDALQPHAERDALIIVDPILELVEVGIAAAEDCSELMNLWVDKGWLSKPSQGELAEYQNNAQQEFEFVIVQPYVFFRT